MKEYYFKGIKEYDEESIFSVKYFIQGGSIDWVQSSKIQVVCRFWMQFMGNVIVVLVFIVISQD